MNQESIEVVAALIQHGDTYLICLRPACKPQGGLWEFAGGKAEPGETPAHALIRECREELGVAICVKEMFAQTTYQYPDRTVHLTLMRAEITGGALTVREHSALRWVHAHELAQYRFCPADIPFLEKLCAEKAEKPRP